ncbi:hypothetical protein GCM10027214_02540 [Stenotrophomonas tumulicola]
MLALRDPQAQRVQDLHLAAQHGGAIQFDQCGQARGKDGRGRSGNGIQAGQRRFPTGWTDRYGGAGVQFATQGAIMSSTPCVR